jgi:hypothetical protein
MGGGEYIKGGGRKLCLKWGAPIQPLGWGYELGFVVFDYVVERWG